MIQDPTPNTFVAGDTVEWTWTHAEYDSSLFDSCTYVFVTPGRQYLITGVAQADGSWLFTIPSASTAEWPDGDYGWQRQVYSGTDRYTAGAGQTRVIRDYSAEASGKDPRSYWQRVIEAIDATIEGRVVQDINQYTISGRSLSKMTLEELLSARGYAEIRLNAWLKKTGQGGYSHIVRIAL